MARSVFYSFHYTEDCHRASLVRNMGVVTGKAPVRDNDWEKITRGGDAAIKRWIGEQLEGTTCTIVLIGAATANRKWINYEIEESWNRGNGVLGIHIHGLKNLNGYQSSRGANPFSYLHFSNTGRTLATVAQTYDPNMLDSKQVYAYINYGLAGWVEQAIKTRNS